MRNDCDSEIVIACALLHDVGIKQSEEELGFNNGKTQEQYGPPAAEAILGSISFPPQKIQKIKEIIGNHHSPLPLRLPGAGSVEGGRIGL